MKKVKVSGVHHVVKKKGKDIVVDHPTINGGKYDKINLTKQTKGKIKTVEEGVKSTKEFHKENPHKYKTKKETEMKTKKTKKMQSGGMLKPVDSTKNPGLAKLPKQVRNKMGFMKNGGMYKTKKK